MAKEKRLRDGKKKRRRKRAKKWSLGEALGGALEQGFQKISPSNSIVKAQRRKKKKKKLQYWETMTAQELEDEFNYWNRQQTTGLTRDELVPQVSIEDADILLVVIDLAVDRDKVSLMKEGKRRDNLHKLLNKLP